MPALGYGPSLPIGGAPSRTRALAMDERPVVYGRPGVPLAPRGDRAETVTDNIVAQLRTKFGPGRRGQLAALRALGLDESLLESEENMARSHDRRGARDDENDQPMTIDEFRTALQSLYERAPEGPEAFEAAQEELDRFGERFTADDRRRRTARDDPEFPGAPRTGGTMRERAAEDLHRRLGSDAAQRRVPTAAAVKGFDEMYPGVRARIKGAGGF